jgi:hypothetical protein
MANRNFYNFLLSIGLMPNKSLKSGAVNVPDEYFADFFRGLIDGDGCIRKWTHPGNKKEQWSLRIYSGSGSFIKWLHRRVDPLLKITGRVYRKTRWILKYGKMAARVIAQKCYYKNALALDRKRNLASVCVDSYRGWARSKTVAG